MYVLRFYVKNMHEKVWILFSTIYGNNFKTPNIQDDVDLHFIAFVEKEGHLYELDGAKEFPINHGPISSDKLLEVHFLNTEFKLNCFLIKNILKKSTCEVVKKLIDLNPEEVRFNLIGLAAKMEWDWKLND